MLKIYYNLQYYLFDMMLHRKLRDIFDLKWTKVIYIFESYTFYMYNKYGNAEQEIVLNRTVLLVQVTSSLLKVECA